MEIRSSDFSLSCCPATVGALRFASGKCLVSVPRLANLVLGTTLNCLFDDSSTTTTPSRHDRHKKTDLYESIDSMRTQPPRWLAVCVRTHAVMQDSHFNLVSCTPTDLTTGPTTKGAHYLENGIGTRRQMGIRGGHYGFIDPLTSRWQT